MPPEPAPLPVSACYQALPKRCFVTFDRQLATLSGLDAGNWFVRYGNVERGVDVVSSDGLVATLQLGADYLDSGPDVVSYSPPPFDLTGVTGTPVEAFTDFAVGPC